MKLLLPDMEADSLLPAPEVWAWPTGRCPDHHGGCSKDIEVRSAVSCQLGTSAGSWIVPRSNTGADFEQRELDRSMTCYGLMDRRDTAAECLFG
jgi:hypothetical protein